MAATKGSRSPRQVRGKRRLEFDPQPFRGKTFFLDLPGYKHISELKHQLTARGAVIENFLDRKVRYLITNRSKDEIKRSTGSSGSPNHASPLTPSTGGGFPNSNPSPSSFTPKSVPLNACTTRAQKMVHLSLQRSGGSQPTDLLTVASGWKCKIVQIEAVEAELRKLKPTRAGAIQEISSKPSRGSLRVRKLQTPFFKAEDVSHKYRPIVYETTQWPMFDPSSFLNSSPGKAARGCKLGSSGDFKKDEKRLGFCECCGVHYKNLDVHLKSSQHRQYATNKDNFKELDQLIAKCISLDEFVQQLKQSTEQEKTPVKKSKRIKHAVEESPLPPLPAHRLHNDDVFLISLPSTPSKVVAMPAKVAATPPKVAATPTSVCTKRPAVSTPVSNGTLPEHTPGFSPLYSLRRSVRKRRLVEETTPTTTPKQSRKGNAKKATPSKEEGGVSDELNSSQHVAEQMALEEFLGTRRKTRQIDKRGPSLLQSAQVAELSYWQQVKTSPCVDS